MFSLFPRFPPRHLMLLFLQIIPFGFSSINVYSSSGAGDWCSQICRPHRCLSEALHCRHNGPETFTAVQEKSLLNILSSSVIKLRHSVKLRGWGLWFILLNVMLLNAPESRNRLVLISQISPLNFLFSCEENMQKLKMQLISFFLLTQTSCSWILLTLILQGTLKDVKKLVL